VGGAQTDILPPPLNGDPLDPALAAALGDGQDQPVLIVIPARLPDPSDEGEGQSAWGFRRCA